jgi:aspartyl-tRNA(Asn)/glutamyl-tRNA(Gln) amidotransferase subunit A
LNDYDFLISPVTPTTAFKLGDKMEDPLQMYLADIFTVQANVVGMPAISLPNGQDSSGLPIGIQLMTRAYEEQSLFSFSSYVTDLIKGKVEIE